MNGEKREQTAKFAGKGTMKAVAHDTTNAQRGMYTLMTILEVLLLNRIFNPRLMTKGR